VNVHVSIPTPPKTMNDHLKLWLQDHICHKLTSVKEACFSLTDDSRAKSALSSSFHLFVGDIMLFRVKLLTSYMFQMFEGVPNFYMCRFSAKL